MNDTPDGYCGESRDLVEKAVFSPSALCFSPFYFFLVLWPYNYSANGKPITRLIVDNDSGSKGNFAPVRKGVKVQGVFGYSSSPPEVVAQACRIQVVKWVMRAKASWQDATINQQAGEFIYARGLDPDVVRLLGPLKMEFMI